MIIIARVKAQEGKEKEFEAKFAEMVGRVQEEKGTLMYRLVQSASDSTEYAVIEEYESQEAVDFHLNTSYFKEIGEELGAVTTGPPQIDLFSEKLAITRD